MRNTQRFSTPHFLLASACNSLSLFLSLSLSLSVTGEHGALVGETERERGRERERKNESEKGGEKEKEGGREREICRIFLKGMTGALAPFRYIV